MQQDQWRAPPMPENFPAGRKELCFAGFVLLFSLLSVNGLFFGGLNLCFALGCMAGVGAVTVFLLKSHKRPTAYSISLLVLSMVILAGFAWSDDGFVKLVLLAFVFLAVSLAVTVFAGRNSNDGRSVRSVGSALCLTLGGSLGGISRSLGGLADSLRRGKGRNVLAVLGGLAIAVPVLLILVPLLIKADAAFDGMMGLLPEFQFSELFLTLLFGCTAAVLVFSFNMSMVHDRQEYAAEPSAFRGVNPVTVYTVLVLVCGVYVLYLVSQLAYLSGGLAGILPQDFTLAQYARRGFFEMAMLCLVNLAVMVGTVALIRKDGGVPALCRWLCAFIGLITLFFVVSAAAKMGLYIQGYGLTRLRILTLVITVFLGLCALILTLWLFIPRLPYMKIILLTALVIGAVVLWVDVDAVVAAYNVDAYLDGRMQYVDVEYLKTLSDGAVPHIRRLTGVRDDQVAAAVRDWLKARSPSYDDLRGWNFVSWNAGK